MGMGLEGMTYQLEGKRELLSLPYFRGSSHSFQFSYCKVKGDGSAGRLVWKRKEKKKALLMAAVREYAIKNKKAIL